MSRCLASMAAPKLLSRVLDDHLVVALSQKVSGE